MNRRRPASAISACSRPVPMLSDVDTGTAAMVAPPVPAEHCVAPCLSQEAGYGAIAASVLVPLLENVGLWQLLMTMFWTLTPGILRSWLKAACTRLIGSGE